MKTNSLKCIWSCLLVLFFTNGQSQILTKALTYQEAVELTLKNSHVVKQNEYLVKEKSENARAAMGMYLPKVGIMANYVTMSDDVMLNLTSVRDAITPLYSALANYGNFSGVPNPDPLTHPFMPVFPDSISTQIIRGKLSQGLLEVQNGDWDPVLQEKQFATLNGTVQWVLYAGGKVRAANTYARLEKTEATYISTQKESELMSELVQRYYGLCLAKQALLVRKDVYAGINKHLSDASKLYKEGLINQADLLYAQFYNANAEKDLKNAEKNVDIISKSLSNTLCAGDTINYEPASPLFYNDSIEPLDYFINKAKDNSSLLAQVEVKEKMAKVNYNVQHSGYLPEIAVQGVYDIANKDLSPYVPDWTVSVGMRWNIFDGGTAYRKMKAASDKRKQVGEIKEKANDDIETMITKLYNELDMYREQINDLDTAKKFGEEYLRVMQKSFTEQMTEESKLVDAKLSLAKIDIEQLQVMYNYDVTLANLLQYSGISGEFINYSTKNAKTKAYKPLNIN